jgi:hypothetical protein
MVMNVCNGRTLRYMLQYCWVAGLMMAQRPLPDHCCCCCLLGLLLDHCAAHQPPAETAENVAKQLLHHVAELAQSTSWD